jgi:hypothetical protein
MIGKIRSRLTSAHVLSAVALFVALGGTAFAATFGKDSVKSRHVADNKLKSKDLKDGKGVKSEDVIDGSLASTDLANEARGAYGKVDAGGGLTNARNVTGVSRPDVGVYCITLAAGIDPATAVLLVTPDNQQNGTNPGAESVSVVEWDSQVDGCPAGTLEVNTFVYDGDDIDNDGGTANSAGDDLIVNNEAFSFAVP